MKAWPLPALLLPLLSLLSPSSAADAITLASPLTDGHTLASAGGAFELGFFSPGTSKNRYLGIWYKNITASTVVWVANRDDPIPANSTGYLKIGEGGNLIIGDQSGTIFWSTASSNLISPIAQLLDTGNFMLRESSSNGSESFAWQSFDHPTDTLLPQMKLGWNLRTGLDRYLTTWKSPNDPSAGDYYFKIDPHGSPQVFIWHRDLREYRNGPWNGVRFSGEPQMESNSVFTFEFVDNQDEIYYKFLVNDSSVLSRFVMNQSLIQRYVWIDPAWSLYWSLPRDQCDYYGHCGTYGVCDSNETPICSCLRGFSPKSPQNWKLNDASAGCVRTASLYCQGDGFMLMSGMKLPDTSNATVNKSLSLEQCRERCLKNCSCLAYASSSILGGGSGCIIWATELIDLRQFANGGQDLYVRLAASELDNSGRKKKMVAIVVVSVMAGLLLLGCSGFYIWNKFLRNYGNRRNAQRQASFESVIPLASAPGNRIEDESSKEEDLLLPLFDMNTIVNATNDFSISNKLGQGGFGTVYKGELENGQMVAVKRLSKHSTQGLDELKNEVRLIAKLQHVNLVRLLGCCIEGEERILIYEYMDNKSLDTFIFDKAKASQLTWPMRYNIIVGIARGLLYLHQDSRFRIIHRDLKASNILLDREMNPKISDFGVARIFGGDESDSYTKRVVGTYGYMAPEYAMDGIFSVKSDIFSFGVLVLEIISGKKNRGVFNSNSQLNLLNYACRLWSEGNALGLLDEAMPFCHSSEVLRCIHISLLCTQERAEDRPHMSLVTLMLGGLSMVLPQPKLLGYCSDRSTADTELSTCTVNNITVTVVEGR